MKEYFIRITYKNGLKEKLDSFDGYYPDTTKYADMVKLWHKIKESKKGMSCTLAFVKFEADNEYVMWTKTYKDEIDNSIDIIKDQISKVDSGLKNSKKLESAFDKEISILLHSDFEFVEDANILDKEVAFDKLKSALIKRRENKNRVIIYDKIKEDIAVIMKRFEDIDEKITKDIDRTVEKTEKQVKNESPNQVMEKVSYKDFKDRMRLIKDLNKIYRKIVNDDANKMLICYDKKGGVASNKSEFDVGSQVGKLRAYDDIPEIKKYSAGSPSHMKHTIQQLMATGKYRDIQKGTTDGILKCYLK